MIRKVKGAVGVCKACGSDAVISIGKNYSDNQKHISVTCSNPTCRKHTPGYDNSETAIQEWKTNY